MAEKVISSDFLYAISVKIRERNGRTMCVSVDAYTHCYDA